MFSKTPFLSNIDILFKINKKQHFKTFGNRAQDFKIFLGKWKRKYKPHAKMAQILETMENI